jgi:hypothetical protein
MLVDISSILATGHEAGVIAQGESREEAEKRLAATLMRGSPIIAMDNCELPLEGVLLNQTLTQQRVELRILGLSKIIVAQTMAVFTATGNNLTIKGDLTRRSVVGRLDPKVAQPELRDFAYDPIADAKSRGEWSPPADGAARLSSRAAQSGRRRRSKLRQMVDSARRIVWLGQGGQWDHGVPARSRPTIINLRRPHRMARRVQAPTTAAM